MTPTPARSCTRIRWSIVALFVALLPLHAQVAPNLPDSKHDPRRGDPPVQTNAGGTRGSETESIQLTPFEVRADSDLSYGALNSNSVTRFNTELQRLPISADI